MVMVLNGCTWVPLQHPLAQVAFLSFVASTMGPPMQTCWWRGFLCFNWQRHKSQPAGKYYPRRKLVLICVQVSDFQAPDHGPSSMAGVCRFSSDGTEPRSFL